MQYPLPLLLLSAFAFNRLTCDRLQPDASAVSSGPTHYSVVGHFILFPLILPPPSYYDIDMFWILVRLIG